ncbi:MAG: DUF559 domain-containing protein [Kiritimatiellia bacterium]
MYSREMSYMAELMPCPTCGTVRLVNKTNGPCRKCYYRQLRKAREFTATCSECGKPVIVSTGQQKENYRVSGTAYCSTACRDAYRGQISSITMSKTNRRYASRRMKEHNPMANPEIRAKATATLREMGWKPQIQGGNGRGPTVPQANLAAALNWPMEVIVRTHMSRDSGYPTHYKLDIGSRQHRLAIEVDGYTHGASAIKAKDAKKTAFLNRLGWTVLRFSNQEVLENLDACVQTVMSTILRLNHTTPTSQTG